MTVQHCIVHFTVVQLYTVSTVYTPLYWALASNTAFPILADVVAVTGGGGPRYQPSTLSLDQLPSSQRYMCDGWRKTSYIFLSSNSLVRIWFNFHQIKTPSLRFLLLSVDTQGTLPTQGGSEAESWGGPRPLLVTLEIMAHSFNFWCPISGLYQCHERVSFPPYLWYLSLHHTPT